MKVGLITKTLFSPFGYGTMVRNIVREWVRQGLALSLFPDGGSWPQRCETILTAEDRALFHSLMTEQVPDVWLHIAAGCRFGPRV